MLVWRHGRTAWNVAGRVQGQTDTALDQVGRAQAASAARRLATLRPARILTSDLQRARHTAEQLAALTGVPAEVDPRLRELDFGAREGLTLAESWEQMPEAMRAWVSGDETRVPGAETHRSAGARFAAAVHDALADLPDDELLVVVAHGGVIRAGVCTFLDFPEAHWRTFGALDNCAWSLLTEFGPPQHRWWRLSEWNTGTLPDPLPDPDPVDQAE